MPSSRRSPGSSVIIRYASFAERRAAAIDGLVRALLVDGLGQRS